MHLSIASQRAKNAESLGFGHKCGVRCSAETNYYVCSEDDGGAQKAMGLWLDIGPEPRVPFRYDGLGVDPAFERRLLRVCVCGYCQASAQIENAYLRRRRGSLLSRASPPRVAERKLTQ